MRRAGSLHAANARRGLGTPGTPGTPGAGAGLASSGAGSTAATGRWKKGKKKKVLLEQEEAHSLGPQWQQASAGATATDSDAQWGSTLAVAAKKKRPPGLRV